jgi:hypothetical protein
MLYKEFYAELGKLLYAVADIDGAITQREKRIIKDIVKKELVPKESHTDEFGTDAAYYAEFEFDVLDELFLDPEDALRSFTSFVEEHHTAFDRRMINVCIRVAEKLAFAYHSGKGKEKYLIERLKKRLHAIDEYKVLLRS